MTCKHNPWNFDIRSGKFIDTGSAVSGDLEVGSHRDFQKVITKGLWSETTPAKTDELQLFPSSIGYRCAWKSQLGLVVSYPRLNWGGYEVNPSFPPLTQLHNRPAKQRVPRGLWGRQTPGGGGLQTRDPEGRVGTHLKTKPIKWHLSLSGQAKQYFKKSSNNWHWLWWAFVWQHPSARFEC